MKKSNLAIAILILLTTNVYSQTVIDKFFSVNWDASISSVKPLFPNEKFTDKNFQDLTEISFFEKIDSIIFKVGFFFANDGVIKAKAISNIGKTVNSGKYFYNFFKDLAVKQFGENFEKKLVYGAEVMVWNIGTDAIVMLSQKDEKAALTITKRKDPKNSSK